MPSVPLAATALLLLAASCLDRSEVTTPSGSERPSLAISDAVHSGGNGHFYFLPPLVPQPNAAGTFDGSLSPVVDICEWAGSCGAVVARFTTTTGTGGNTVSQDPSAKQYQVNWDTKVCVSGPCALDPAKTYRLRVVVAGTLLGFADVDVVSNGSQLKNVQTNDYIGLVSGRTLPVKFRIEQGAINVVSSIGGSTVVAPAQGATVATAGGEVALSIPPGAIAGTSPVTISVAPASASEAPPGPGQVPGTAFAFGPDGAAFATPLTLKLSYDPSRIPAGVPEKYLRLHTFNPGTGNWQPVEGSSVDPVGHSVTGVLNHFSAYSAMLEAPPDAWLWDSNFGGGNNFDIGGSAPFTLQLGDPTKMPASLGFPIAWLWASFHTEVGGWICGQTHVYESTNPAVLLVDSVVTADITDDQSCVGVGAAVFFTPRTVGTAYMRATFDGYSDSLAFKVVNPTLLIDRLIPTFELQGFVLAIGQTGRDTAFVHSTWGMPLPSKVVTWTIDNPAVAHVTPVTNQSADVTGLAAGCAFVTARADDTVSSRLSVIVRPKPVDIVAVTFNPTALFTMTATGCGAERVPGVLDAAAQSGFTMRWSPDGSKFAWIRDNPRVLTIANWDGSAVHVLPSYGAATQLAWSPDGTKIAYGALNAGIVDIRLINADGSGDHALTSSGGTGLVADAPEWSPDGTRIIFHRGVSLGRPWPSTTTQGSNSVYMVHIDGTGEQLLVANDGAHSPSYPVYSPDGSRILYLDALANGTEQLALVNPDGTGRQMIYSRPLYPTDSPNRFHWSPNGQMVQFGEMVINATGTGAIAVAVEDDARSWSWSSDSRQLLYQNAYGLWRINADGTGRTQISGYFTSGFQGAAEARWRSTSPSVP
jgi:hypothetical protein